MADELTLNTRFYYNKAGTVIDERTTNLQIDVSGTIVTHTVQTVGTTEEALDLSGVNDGLVGPGYMLAINRDATNYVEIKPAEGDAALIKLKAGEVSLFRLSTDATAPMVQANTAEVNLEYWILQGDALS